MLLHFIAEGGVEKSGRAKINGAVKHIGESSFEGKEAQKARTFSRFEFDEEIEVAFGTLLPAKRRSKDGQPLYMILPAYLLQSLAVIIEFVHNTNTLRR